MDEILIREIGKIPLFWYDTLDSTNSEAKRRAAELALPAVIVADAQSAGRGRMGRSFFSPRGTGLYFSYVTDRIAPAETVGLTAAAAVATARAIRAVTGIEVEIKWVNDLLQNGKKVAGILCERFAVEDRTCVVVGIGINLSTAEHDFPEELREKAGSLGMREDVRRRLAQALAEELHTLLCTLPDHTFMAEYRARSAVLGRRVRYTQNGVTYEGEAVTIDDDGALCVKTDGQTVRLGSGEISLSYENL